MYAKRLTEAPQATSRTDEPQTLYSERLRLQISQAMRYSYHLKTRTLYTLRSGMRIKRSASPLFTFDVWRSVCVVQS